MKRAFFVGLFFIFCISLVSAIEFKMNENFKQGETLTAIVSGNFLDAILPGNIYFYRGHVQVPFEFDVAQIQEEYHIYALLPETQDNYSIIIKDVRYRQGAQVIDKDIEKNFSITSEKADFSIDPGFVITNGIFSIKVQNLKDSKISLNINNEKIQELKSGDIENINFKIQDINETILKKILLSTINQKYEVSVYIVANDTKLQKDEFDFSKPFLNYSFIINKQYSIPIEIENTGEKDLENISFSVSRDLRPYLNISVIEIDSLEKGKTSRIELSVFSNKEISVKGTISAFTDETLIYLPIELKILKSFISVNDGNTANATGLIYIPETQNSCFELSGSFCTSVQICNQTINAIDGKCCLSGCEALQSDNGEDSSGEIIGWLIIILILAFVAWFFFKKYKKTK
ncbi:MAG: hypothetical protein AABX30_03275 [Nanoarchaeota archaeon]